MSNYSDLLNAVEQYYGAGSDEWAEIAKYGISSDKAAQILKQVPGVDIWVNANGSVRSYNLKATENITSTAEQAVNSNVPAAVKSFEIPSNSGIETVTSETGETVKQMTFKSGMKQAGSFVFGEIVPALAATATGITLGKTFDKLLYNVSPDFWDEHGMSTLDPDTWGDIIGTDTAGGRVLNTILGTTPDHKTQAYIDQNALAYMALYMQNKGAFTITEEFPDNAEVSGRKLDKINFGSGITNVVHKYFDEEGTFKGYYLDGAIGRSATLINIYAATQILNNNVKWFWYTKDGEIHKVICSSIKTNFGITPDGSLGYKTNNNYDSYTNEGKEVYYWDTTHYSDIYEKIPSVNNITGRISDYAWYLFYGNLITKGIDGIGTQEDATTPDLSKSTTVQEALDALKEQFPELWDNAVEQDVVQPDGSVKTYVYVPVAMPDIDENGNPISSSSTQADPQVQPETSTKSLLDLITKIIQRDPPVNPPDTGDGVTPVVPPATGSASSLYAIYNPTLAQINSFGAWLWSDNFVDQIKKLFNDPMQAIIGLHKIYATPATGGAQTIKVGYLDSGVSAKVVSNQYTTIDCGTVRLSEQFHNVFDYSPYTEVNLYLPFIGIVNINVSDVMRSSIHIVYHVDVLSGACLAEVKVTRDSAGGTLYQYAGNASVTLPISSGSYMGIVSAVAGVAGGIAGTIASGGSALPLIASSAGAMFNAHTRVEHSGGFSGNAGAMGGKIPYLIISRPQTEMAEGFENYIGYPSNFTATIGSCTGFIKVIECHVENTNATNSELTEINTMLQEGVIV